MQGESSAPDLVKSCISSIKRNSGCFRVIVLSDSNLRAYVKLPNYIWDKYESGYITKTHLSDIIRSYLLSHYGGYWIDATIYLLHEIEKPTIDFITLKDEKINQLSVSNGQWTGYFMYSKKDGILITKLFNAFLNYWKHESYLIDYFLIDYFIKYLISSDELIMKIHNDVPCDGQDRFLLSEYMSLPVSTKRNDELIKGYGVYKLSYKVSYKKEVGERSTYFNFLLNDTLSSLLKK